MVTKFEVFTCQPLCYWGKILTLIEEVKRKYGSEVEIEVHRGLAQEASRYGVKVSPAFVVDGKLLLSGRIPQPEELLLAIQARKGEK